MSAVASGEPDLALGQGQSDMNSAAPCPLAVPQVKGVEEGLKLRQVVAKVQTKNLLKHSCTAKNYLSINKKLEFLSYHS